MWILDLINKKKLGQSLTNEEINFIVNKFNAGKIADYQMSAFLMALWFKGLDMKETSSLTQALVNSGETLDLSSITGFKVDKHSTGGVGDKVTFIYSALVASFGLKVVKASGRGLGQTGGTIDKLEGIPNFNVNLSVKEFIEVVNECGMAIMGQSKNITPADKKIYALRDATSTVDALSLVASSVMAKKIAMNSDGVVLDIKCGTGAFMNNLSSAKLLANTMLEIAKTLKVNVSAVISDMSQPLGRTIGNICEVQEAYQFLAQEIVDEQLLELVTTLAAISLVQAKKYNKVIDAKLACIEQLKTKLPLQIFEKFVVKQQGNLKFLQTFQWKNHVKYILEIKALKSGYVNFIDCYGLGMLAMHLGAGRKQQDDQIDFMAGIYLNKKHNDYVAVNETILTLFTNIDDSVTFINQAKKLFNIELAPLLTNNVIYEVII